MKISTFEWEEELLNKQEFSFVIGTDEAGRGPLAGPVVAAAAIVKNAEFRISNFESNSNDLISNDKNWDLVRDSKTLSAKQRDKAFDFVLENFYVGVGICDHKTVDEINVLEASFLAMKKALSDLYMKINQDLAKDPKDGARRIQDTKYIVLVDGNKKIPNLSLYQKAVIGGDGVVKSISAASIVAKVARDRMMQEAHEKYPQYGFDRHKGYGTKVHMEALNQFGPCEIHRQSFEPMPTLAKKGYR
jgi:ribonuclease HII